MFATVDPERARGRNRGQNGASIALNPDGIPQPAAREGAAGRSETTDPVYLIQGWEEHAPDLAARTPAIADAFT